MRPNIIFILSDQQRWDTLGCYGQPLSTTPNLDRMAADGLRFENAFTCQPVCGPARSCLQTGKYATETGCHINNIMLPLKERTIAHRLADHGYSTAYIGKWHLASEGPRGGANDFTDKPVPRERRGGYEYWLAADVLEFTSHGYEGHMFDGEGNRRSFPEGRYRVDAQTDWAIEYLRQVDCTSPFFLFLSYLEPHHQNDRRHYEGPHGSKERFKDFVPPGDLRQLAGDWREEYPDYLGCVSSLDENVGRILRELDDMGIADDTIVIYTSDHGSHFRTRNPEYKRSCHDACIRVPLLIRGPGFKGGAVIQQLVSLIDLPSTLMTAAGIAPPTSMRGNALQKLVSGDSEGWPEEVFVQISESHCGRAIRTAEWKYSARAPGVDGDAPASGVYEDDCLYDLREDPHELENLVGHPRYASVLNLLRDALRRRILSAGEAEPTIRGESGNAIV